MSLFKAIFGDNEDKKKIEPNSENFPKSEPLRDPTVEMIPMEELYRLEEMHIPEGLELPKKEEQKKVDNQTGTTQPKDSAGVAQPDGKTIPGATVNPSGTTQPKGTGISNTGVQQTKGKIKGAIPPKGAFVKPFVPKPIVVDTKLTIILVENTNEVAKVKDKLKAIIQMHVTTGYICVINYGTLVRESEIVEAKNFDCDKLLHKDFVGDNACLFDAIDTLEEVVKKNYKKSEEIKNKRVRIQSIDVIGIGRCFDNCSITSSEIASESFSKVARHTDVTTKYFCLTEESFIAAATIGFHSIGAITRSYM